MNPRVNNLFNLKSFNSLKKDQTNIKIFKNSSFDSSFNSVQSLNTNISQLQLLPSLGGLPNAQTTKAQGEETLRREVGSNASWRAIASCCARSRSSTNIKNPKFSAQLRAIRAIRLNRDEWKLSAKAGYINLMEKKLRNSPLFGYPLGASFSSSSISSSYTYTNPNFPHTSEGNRQPKEGVALRSTYLNSYFYSNNKNFTSSAANIISKNILLRNMKYNFLKSTLSSILKKKIRKISEILEDKPIKNYALYSYLKFCIFSPPHINGGRTKLSLNKYKGRKLGSFINYNKIIGYKFNSTFYQANHNCLAPFAPSTLNGVNSSIPTGTPLGSLRGESFTCFATPISRGLEKRRGSIYIKDIYKLLFYLFKSMYCLISKPVLKYTNDKVTIQLFYYLNIPKKKVFRLFSISCINSWKKKWLAKSLPCSYAMPLLPLGEALPLLYLDKIKEKGPRPKTDKAPETEKDKEKDKNKERPSNKDPNLREGIHSSLPLGKDLHQSARGGTLLPRSNTKIYWRWKLRKAISRFKNKNISSKNLLFNLRKFNLTAKAVFQNKIKLICAILSTKFNKPVELQLIRLHHPYHDSNILVNLLSLNIKNKRKKARVAVQKIFNKKPVKSLNDPIFTPKGLTLNRSTPYGHPLSIEAGLCKGKGEERTGNLLPAFVSGLNIKIAGRLMGEPIIPRITNKIFGKGASATGKVNYLDVARITKKNRKGAYTIKITSGQNFF